jgi:hypothetical protein
MTDERKPWPFPSLDAAAKHVLHENTVVGVSPVAFAALKAENALLRDLVQRALDLHEPDEAKVRPYGKNAHDMKILAVYKQWNAEAREALR